MNLKLLPGFPFLKWLIVFFCCFGLQNIVLSQSAPEIIILDTDMGSDCDDVGAMALLHVYADQQKADFLGCIYSSGKIPYGVGVIDAINTYFGRPDLPLGADMGEKVGDPKDKMTAEKFAKDTAAYHHDIIYKNDAVEQTILNRKLLAAQEDNSVIYITIGHTKGLADLLKSEPDEYSKLNGHDLVKQKVKKWIALGALSARKGEGIYGKDWNFYQNGAAPYTKYVVDHIPVPTVFIGCGSTILTGKSLAQTPSGNIIRTAYRDWLWNMEKKTLADQRPSWDIIAVFYALEGLGDYLVEAEEGWLEVDEKKGCRWIAGENKTNQKYIILKEGKEQDFADYLNKMIATLPKDLK